MPKDYTLVHVKRRLNQVRCREADPRSFAQLSSVGSGDQQLCRPRVILWPCGVQLSRHALQ